MSAEKKIHLMFHFLERIPSIKQQWLIWMNWVSLWRPANGFNWLVIGEKEKHKVPSIQKVNMRGTVFLKDDLHSPRQWQSFFSKLISGFVLAQMLLQPCFWVWRGKVSRWLGPALHIQPFYQGHPFCFLHLLSLHLLAGRKISYAGLVFFWAEGSSTLAI
jgi:hypothetical protein